ncbi:HAD family hydrolase [Companilactobacillus musae]|uniref:HAD-IIB family hydrolase n=1 Tax=Companilactobacillus musae TaxID=1903258 RepID=UPI000E64D024|nr:HAD family hydrolase [Companilactobacillus musae]
MQYIFDVDGTLSFDGKTISPLINRAIKDLIDADNEVIFASARPIRDLLPMIPSFTDHKLIGANGAMISLAEEIKVISKIPDKDFMLLKILIDKFELNYIVDSSWNYASRITQSSFIERMIDPAQLAEKITLDEIIEPIKTIFVNVDNELQHQLITTIKEKTSLNIIGLSGEGTVDITASGINKFSTLKYLEIEDYVAFGNDCNDLEMLAGATRSVWINSKPDLQEFSRQMDIICKPDPEAVANTIRSFI